MEPDKSSSLAPMKFGTERDFHIALTELRWMEKSAGKLVPNDFEYVAEKYNFPVDFLKQGIEGLSFPEDYMVSKSKWFPIIYAWDRHFSSLSDEYFRLTVRYVRWSGRLLLAIIIIPIIGATVASTIWNFGYASFSTLTPVITLTISGTVSIVLWLLNKRSEARRERERFFIRFEAEAGDGPRKDSFLATIKMTNLFVTKNWIAANIIAKGHLPYRFKMNAYKIGEVPLTLESTANRKHLKYLSRFLIRRKKSAEAQSEAVPIVIGENPDVEYSKRIEALNDAA